MADGIIYLDADDEITSAAARIRRSESRRVAVVLPYGSRVATSRINFRLLSRDALTHEKRLSIVAPDAATRALAASAGLPVFATVGEYEESLDEGPPGRGRTAAAPAGVPVRDDDEEGAPEPYEPEPEPEPEREPPAQARPRGRRRPTSGLAEAGAAAATAAAAADAAGPVTARARPAGDDPGPTDATTRYTAPRQAPAPAPEPLPRPATSIPVIGSRRGPALRTPALVGGAVLALALLVVGVGAWVLLPSATVFVTLREEAVGPLRFSVRADPSASQPDAVARIVPAERLTLDVSVEGTFPATGRRVEQTRARGEVTFESYDPGGQNTIPAGSIVSTEGGVQFRTLARLRLPAAEIIQGNQAVIRPSRGSVAVEAVRQGPNGNVPANAITVVPQNENPVLTKVRNPDETTGGTREEFPLIEEADVAAAIEELRGRLEAEFRARLDDPSIVPPDTTLFPDTADLGEGVPSVPAEELVGQEQTEFELALTAEGSVIAVNPAPVESIAGTLLEAEVREGRELVDGSVSIEPGEPVVDGQDVSFPVVAEARQVRRPDPAELEALILGRSAQDAREALAPFGDVELVLWPDWVTSVPTLDARVEVELRDPAAIDDDAGDGAADDRNPAGPAGTP